MSFLKKVRIYIAGSLFKIKQIKARLEEGKELRDRFGDSISVYNPIEQPFNDKANNNPTAEEIFEGDTKELLKSKLVLADLDDEYDSGLMVEIGIAIGVNISLDQIKQDVPSEYFDIVSESLGGYKKIISNLTDIRLAQDGKGIYSPYGYNQFVIGAVEKYGVIKNSMEEVYDEVEKYLNYNK